MSSLPISILLWVCQDCMAAHWRFQTYPQNKLAVRRLGSSLAAPCNGSPSTAKTLIWCLIIVVGDVPQVTAREGTDVMYCRMNKSTLRELFVYMLTDSPACTTSKLGWVPLDLATICWTIMDIWSFLFRTPCECNRLHCRRQQSLGCGQHQQ
jgi:hypothetical protein